MKQQQKNYLHLLLYVHVCSVVSGCWQPRGLKLTRQLCPWNFSSKNTGVGCCLLLQGIFLVKETVPSVFPALTICQTDNETDYPTCKTFYFSYRSWGSQGKNIPRSVGAQYATGDQW